MSPRDVERQLFCEGCVIEIETNTSDDRLIRVVSTLKGERYRLLYRRNEHHVFVVYEGSKIL